MDKELCPIEEELTVCGKPVTREMIQRIADKCGPTDPRFENEETAVERVIFYLAQELDASQVALPPA